MSKRLFDLILCILIIPILLVPTLLIALWMRVLSDEPVIYWSSRIGKHNRNFQMPKFRSMCLSTPQIATHLLDNPETYITPLGRFLRRTSLDELPQLWSIWRGDMSFVGPRPALFNQHDLIVLRTRAGVHRLTPGITGWAQVNGRDDLSIPQKVMLDAEYLHRQSLWFDIRILCLTVKQVWSKNGISH